MMKKYIRISSEVKEAVEKGKPVVALESTIISHGMPYPENIRTAIEIEKIIRNYGVIPATIGIIEGEIIVGLNNEEIEFLGKEKNIHKASRRDLPVIVSKKMHAATTVAATMICADLAGIRIFATGGIGGVHRGAEKTFDVSADLMELATTNVAVVCAGAKSILDIPLTLEKLETLGVPVLGYKTKRFPAFYTRDSGLDCDYKMDSTEEIASALSAKWDMGLEGGVIVANPIPEEYEMEKKYIEGIIEDALKKADELNIKGKDITPYLLDKIKEMTESKSLDSNIQLVFNNAAIGAQIALDYSRQGTGQSV
jgi:pseudouridine-5'-phosphate glycosidase